MDIEEKRFEKNIEKIKRSNLLTFSNSSFIIHTDRDKNIRIIAKNDISQQILYKD